MSAPSRPKPCGGHYQGLVAGNIAHGDESEDGGADGENAGDCENGTFAEGLLEEAQGFVRVVPLQEIDGDDYLIAYEDQGVEIAQTNLSDAVSERYGRHDAQDGAYYLEDGGEGESFHVGDSNERYGGGAVSGKAYHGNEKHGDKQSCGDGQEETLYSEKHFLIISFWFNCRKNREKSEILCIFDSF